MDSGRRLQRGNKRQHIYEEIKDLIRNDDFDERTLTEVQLSQRLAVSRTPVRAALLQLKIEGWLEEGPYGLRVRVLDNAEILETYAIREALEGAAAKLAASRATPAELIALQETARAFASAVEGAHAPEALEEMNARFHALMHLSSHSALLRRILEPLQLANSRFQQSTFSRAGRAAASAAEHDEIVKALMDRDGKKAEDVARAHVRAGAEARSRLIADTLIAG